MLFRLIKLLNTFYLLVIGCVVSLFFAYQSDKKSPGNEQISYRKPPPEDGAKCAKYTMKLKDGVITVSSAKASIKNFDSIILSDVVVSMSRDRKNMTRHIELTAEHCELKPKKKRANLTGKIIIKSTDFSASTRSVFIDWLKGTISGNSPINGQKGNMKFTASGFLMKSNGKVELKNAKIVKCK